MSLSPAGLSPEALLLLCSCKPNVKERRQELADVFAQRIDWRILQENALHNRLESLLFCRLKESGLDSLVPAEILEALEAVHQDTLFVNMTMSRELVRIIDAFEFESIPMMPFKGPLLAAQIYDDLSHRQYWDLDLLIQPSQIEKSKSLLEGLGYVVQSLSNVDGGNDASRTEMIFQKDDQISLELHWNIVDKSYSHGFDYESFWSTAGKVVFCGKEVKTLAPEELFYALCVHGGEKHRWSRLKWVVDIAQFLTRCESLNWPYLLRMARQQKRDIYLYEAVFLAHIFFAVPMPAYISGRIRNNWRVESNAALARGRIFRNDQGLPGFSEWKHYMKAHGTDTSFLTALPQFVFAVLTPETKDRDRLCLPPALGFLHLLYRPFRLLAGQRFKLLSRLK